jgi:prolyl-tRNA editing enzyme YbaK/EbsC (Cys-tRNA(Pro) deacylase)
MASRGLDHTDLQRFIDTRGIEAVILPMKTHTPTVADAARALSVETDQIIKSLVFVTPESPVLVINNGLARVDRKKLAAVLGVGRRRVKFAAAEEALALTGFVVGAMPPFGHARPLRTLVDPSVTDWEVVYGGGGEIDAMMRLTSQELLRATGAEVVDLSEGAARPVGAGGA